MPLALFSSCEVARAAFSCEYYNPWNGTSMKTDQDFVKCQFFSRFFVWQCSPSVCKSKPWELIGWQGTFCFPPPKDRKNILPLVQHKTLYTCISIVAFFWELKHVKKGCVLNHLCAPHHLPNPQTSRVLPSPGAMPRFQLHCGRCPLHASETAVCFFLRRIQNFRNLYSVRIDLQDSSMICSYFFNDIFVPFRPPGGLARSYTRRQNVGFHLQHLIWHFLQLLRCCDGDNRGIKRFEQPQPAHQANQSHAEALGGGVMFRNYCASRCVPKKYQSNNQNHVYIYI